MLTESPHASTNMVPNKKMSYRPEIDGLRAFAVIAVVLFHGGFGCSGGYVGVDVFFVISGFLITSLIWNDLQNGRFTFSQFWERRARRIIPAAVVMTLVTLIAGWFLLMPSDFQSLGRAAASQSLFAANIHYWRDLNYFSGAANERPLLHTWTLAVEEQFYFVIPFLLWIVFRCSAFRRRAVVVVVLVIGFVLSIALSYAVLPYKPSAVFYLLPTRAWELILGSLIAFFPTPSPFLGRRIVREAFSLAGLALIVVPVFAYTSNTPFPGLAALPPCLGAALFIWSNGRDDDSVPTSVGTLLSLRPVVFIGLISYSLYLWHWPFMAFANYLVPEPITPSYRALLVGGSLLCAILSWRYIEAPFRLRKCGTSRRTMFAYAGIGLSIVLGCGLICTISKGFPQRLSQKAQLFAKAESDKAFINDHSTQDVMNGNIAKIGVDTPSPMPKVLVWGDSHAMAALPAIDAFLAEKGLSGYSVTHSSTAPVLGWYHRSPHGLSEASVAYNDSVMSFIERRHISNVILIARWKTYAGSDMNKLDSFERSLLETVRHLVSIGSHPWIVSEVPGYSFSIPRVLSLPIYTDEYVASLQVKPVETDSLTMNDPELIDKLREAGASVLDPKPSFIDPSGGKYRFQSEGVALYRDDHHLSTKGAQHILLPFLRDSLKLTPGFNPPQGLM